MTTRLSAAAPEDQMAKCGEAAFARTIIAPHRTDLLTTLRRQGCRQWTDVPESRRNKETRNRSGSAQTCARDGLPFPGSLPTLPGTPDVVFSHRHKAMQCVAAFGITAMGADGRTRL